MRFCTFYLLLLLSWFLAPNFWYSVDVSTFHFLNSWIASNTISQNFWAIMNHGYMDWIFDVVILGFMIAYVLRGPIEDRKDRIIRCLVVTIIGACTIIFMNRYLFKKIYKMKRICPSLTFEGAHRLSRLVPWIKIKDTSKDCFPADHGTTTALFAISMSLLHDRKFGSFAILVAMLFSLPRLIVGAHWLTDILFGGIPIALIAMSWLFIERKKWITESS